MEIRLDAALVAIWPDIEAGDCKAIETMLKIEERRAKLLGLDSWANLLDDADLEQMSDADGRFLDARRGIGGRRIPPPG
jgi:hypothetical protein